MLLAHVQKRDLSVARIRERAANLKRQLEVRMPKVRTFQVVNRNFKGAWMFLRVVRRL